jgi:hypothetical protein
MPAKPTRIAIVDIFRKIPVHAFFLSAYPVLALLAFNIDQIYAQDALRILGLSLLLSSILLCTLRLLSRDWQLAGLLTSLLLGWFFLYGRIYVPLKKVIIFGLTIGRHRYLLIVWTGITILIALWLIKRFRANRDLTMIMNIFSTVLILLPTIQICTFLVHNKATLELDRNTSATPLISWTDDSAPPDIYYIVLDGYVRSDVLQQVYGFDNSTFLSALQDMGFYIPECSRSNYSRTSHSVTSTFNMEYIQTLNTEVAPDADPAWLLPFMKHNLVRQQLEALGYKTIVFKHSWERFVWDDADIVFESSGTARLSPFEYLLLRTTVVRAYLDVTEAETSQLADYKYYEDTLYALKQLQNIPETPGPKFVFAHLIIPHSPFVFGPNGEYDHIPYDADAGNIYDEEEGHRGYVNAVKYINKRMLEIIPNLIRDSETTPIIVVAGDHGTPWGGNLNEFKNLTAIFTPDSDTIFYKTLTQVNIFRIIFDAYFNGDFGLLPDLSYLFTERGRFDYREFPNMCD